MTAPALPPMVRIPTLIGVLLLMLAPPASADPRQWEYAAELGDVASQMRLADAYLNGKGIEVDHRRAAYWYGRAAAQGDPAGQAFLGWMYERGLGLDRNAEIARYWYSKAAASGYAWAIRRLGELDAARERKEAETPRVAADTLARPDSASGAEDWSESSVADPFPASRSGQAGRETPPTSMPPDRAAEAESWPGRARPRSPDPGAAPRPANTAPSSGSDAVGPSASPTRGDPASEADTRSAPTPRSGPDREAAPPLPASEALRDLEQAVRDLVKKSLVFKTPERMDPGEERWVSAGFRLDSSYDRLLVPGVGIRIVAELQGEGVDIEPASAPRQVLRPGIPPHWAWRIVSRFEGERRLRLALRARVTRPADGTRSFRLPERESRIQARPRAWDAMRRFVDEHLWAIIVTLLIPLSLWVALSLRGRSAE